MSSLTCQTSMVLFQALMQLIIKKGVLEREDVVETLEIAASALAEGSEVDAAAVQRIAELITSVPKNTRDNP
jgi:hypothetical protein